MSVFEPESTASSMGVRTKACTERLLRACGYNRHIIPSEPMFANDRTLREHARLEPKWTVMQYALGEPEDALQACDAPTLGGHSSEEPDARRVRA
jgi:hypothetical protein